MVGRAVARTDPHVVVQDVDPSVSVEGSGDDGIRTIVGGDVEHGEGRVTADETTSLGQAHRVTVDQHQQCALAGERDGGCPAVAHCLALGLTGTDDHGDALLQTPGHQISPRAGRMSSVRTPTDRSMPASMA